MTCLCYIVAALVQLLLVKIFNPNSQFVYIYIYVYMLYHKPMVGEMGIYAKIHITASQFWNRISQLFCAAALSGAGWQGFLCIQSQETASWLVCQRMGATASWLLPPGHAVGFGERHCSAGPWATALWDTRIWLLRTFRDSPRAWSPASERMDAPVIQHTAGIWCLHKAGSPSPDEVVSSLEAWALY